MCIYVCVHTVYKYLSHSHDTHQCTFSCPWKPWSHHNTDNGTLQECWCTVHHHRYQDYFHIHQYLTTQIQHQMKTRTAFVKLTYLFFHPVSLKISGARFVRWNQPDTHMHTQSEHLPFCTCARPPIWHQGVPFAAATFVASFCIRALRVAASIHYHALINICENITTTLLVRAISPPPFLKRVFLFEQIV